MDMNVGGLLCTIAQRYPSRIAVIEGDGKKRSCNFRTLNRRVNQLSHGLKSIGLQKGEFVSILMHNCLEFVEVGNALSKIGAVNASLVYRLLPKELVLLVKRCQATTLVFGSEFSSIVEEIKPEIKSVKRFICIGEEVPSFADSYEGIINGQPDTEPDVEIFDDDPHFLNYTSGTTGLPKAVLLSHYNQISGIFATFVNPLELVSADVMSCAFPLYGRIGLAQMFACIMQGARQIIMDFEPVAYLKAVEDHKVTFLHLAPIMSYMIIEELKKNDYDLSSVRGLISVGAPITEPIYNGIRKYITPNVWDYAGTQETAGNYFAMPYMKEIDYATLGTPTLFTKVRVVDHSGVDVPPGETGELICKTSQAADDYYNDPERTKEEIVDGWFYVRDVGYQDENGWISLSGRNKDMIKSGGQQVMAPEVENALLQHSAVADCAVIGLPHEQWGEQVSAAVQLKEGQSVTEDDLISFCREHVAHFKAPKKIIFVSEIPRTATGKAQKFMLVNEYS